ncbi:MAG TPA: hypothetical protein PLD40_04385 [Kiritimatiellia bacterium]|jgi:hypothetical protein|nr:hypothetical protein [Kiritimatiellia bacterium]OQC59976.1 MAG: hypothetical protein BWX54_00414 [Verrucomicrobia bacterium ADurb.Bin018]MBP9572717.1 hypothetical protein [Kiritimatiellia bacterium]HOD99658.1 hypothetical protein [Kiritimatiellia bacterium]HOE36381.1 hypothetical protein [Kiritimatiellia bacterium]
MKHTANPKSTSRAGYSLVEVTLALLVVAIGLTATFALFPEGLRATRSAVDDAEISLFADYVFTTLDLTAAKYGGNYGPNWTIAKTDDFISLMLSTLPSAQDSFELKDGGRTANFYWMPDYYGLDPGKFSGTDYNANSFRSAKFWTSAFTYTLEIVLGTWKGHGQGVTTCAVLKVWPGEYSGSGKPKGEPRTFYREIIPIR